MAMDGGGKMMLTLIARKSCFGLPTACPSCLPVYVFLKFTGLPFLLNYNLNFPDSDQIPYVESDDHCYAAFNNENGGVIETLKQHGIVDLDSGLDVIPEWISIKAMITSWLADAVLYELWLASDGTSARNIYYSDLPWPISKFLYYKQVTSARQLLGVTKENAYQREKEIYRKATITYEALSTRLGENLFLFESRPTSLDALLLGHTLFTLHALPETSDLRSKLLTHANLVKSADSFMSNYIDTNNSSYGLQSRDFLSSRSQFQSHQSTSASGGSSNWRSNPRSKPKREKTEEEKTFRRRAKYFLVTQLAAVLIFLSVLGGSDNVDMELDSDDDGSIYG